MQLDYNFLQLKKIGQKRFEHYLNRKPLNQLQMFWGRGCDGLKGGGEVSQKRIKAYKGEGGLKF